MMKKFLVVMLLSGSALSCGENERNSNVEEACGIVQCNTPNGSDEGLVDPSISKNSKADTQGVESAIASAAKDGEIDASEIEKIFDKTGRKVSQKEMDAIRKGVFEASAYTVTTDALELAKDYVLGANLPSDEAGRVNEGRSFADTEVPQEVTDLLLKARMHGAVVYDVNEMDEDGGRVWTHYPATTTPDENMAFDYTEINLKNYKTILKIQM